MSYVVSAMTDAETKCMIRFVAGHRPTFDYVMRADAPFHLTRLFTVLKGRCGPNIFRNMRLMPDTNRIYFKDGSQVFSELRPFIAKTLVLQMLQVLHGVLWRAQGHVHLSAEEYALIKDTFRAYFGKDGPGLSIEEQIHNHMRHVSLSATSAPSLEIVDAMTRELDFLAANVDLPVS